MVVEAGMFALKSRLYKVNCVMYRNTENKQQPNPSSPPYVTLGMLQN